MTQSLIFGAIWTNSMVPRTSDGLKPDSPPKTVSQKCSWDFGNREVQRAAEDSSSLFCASVLPPTCCCGCSRGPAPPGHGRSFAPGGGPGGNSRSAHVGSSTGTPHSWGSASGGLKETGGGEEEIRQKRKGWGKGEKREKWTRNEHLKNHI